MTTRFLRYLAVIVCAALAPAAGAYPERPIKLVIPFSAGGAADNAARILAEALAKSLGQPVIVDNRAGASGAIAAQLVMAAPADGYTLLWAAASMVSLPMVMKSPPFQSLAEFTPVSVVSRLPYGMFVSTDVPARSVAEFVAFARANPDKVSYATAALSEYMAGEQFMKATGTTLLRVPYKGGAPAIIDLMAGSVQMYITPMSNGLPYAKAGKLRMIATMLPTRSEFAPDVPTFAEAGVMGVGFSAWQAIVAPPKTPREIVERLAAAMRRILADPAIRSAYAVQYLEAQSSTPQELAASIADYTEVWRRFVRDYKIPKE
jgi:tripartite-type tricarboxylate transporter receptor subunit TctC